MLEKEIENKENLKRSRSLEAINFENSLLNNCNKDSPVIPSKGYETKRKLSGLGLKISRKTSDTTTVVVKRKVSIQPEIRVRKASANGETRTRKVSIQPELRIKSPKIPAQKRVRKGSLQAEMMSDNKKNQSKADLKVRKLSVPANMKYHSERVRVKKVSFVNQHTGEMFPLQKTS